MKPRKVKLMCHLKGYGATSSGYFSIACRQRLIWMKNIGYTFSYIRIPYRDEDDRILTFTDQRGDSFPFPEAIILKIWQKEN